MAKTQAAPDGAPAPESTTPPDTQDFRPLDTASLDDATPVAVVETDRDPDAPVGRKPNQHDNAMDGIVAARRKVLERERAENIAVGLAVDPPAIGDDPLNPPEPATQPEPGAAPTPAPAASPQPAGTATPPAGESPRVHKILVRGQNIDVPEPDLIRLAERGLASEARLREADRMLQEAQRLRGSAPQPDQSARPSPPAAPAPTSQSSPPVNRDAALEIARELLYGDEEKVADAILRMQPQPQQMPQIDTEALARQVQERVGTRLQLEQQLITFAGEYSDIVNDAPLTTLAAQYVHQIRAHYAQTETPKSELDIFREAGEAVRSDVRRWTGGAPAAQPNPQPVPATPAAAPGTSARTVIKRATPNAPAAAGAIPTTPAARQRTGTDIVNEMRKARGQPVYA